MKKIYITPEMDIYEGNTENFICASEKIPVDPNTPASSNIDDTLAKDGDIFFDEDEDEDLE